MSDIGIIGSKELIDVFEILGVSVYPAESIDEAKLALAKIIESGEHKIVFVLESLAYGMREEMRNAEDLQNITVVPLPDYRSEVSYLDDELRRLSKEAIGMEI